MTSPSDLLDEWQRDEPGMSPRRVQHLRSDLQQATGLEIPRRRSELREWIDEQLESGELEQRLAGDSSTGEELQELEDINGVGASKADALRDVGFESIEDVKEADQDDLTEADGIGNALAARIKADVGDLEVTEETETAAETEIEDEDESENTQTE